MISDLLPMVDSTYRTIPSRDARAIAGLSTGGAPAFYIGRPAEVARSFLERDEGWSAAVGAAMLTGLFVPACPIPTLFVHV